MQIAVVPLSLDKCLYREKRKPCYLHAYKLNGIYVGDICTRPSAVVRIVEQYPLRWLSGKVASFTPAGETFVDDVHRGALGSSRVIVGPKVFRMREGET